MSTIAAATLTNTRANGGLSSFGTPDQTPKPDAGPERRAVGPAAVIELSALARAAMPTGIQKDFASVAKEARATLDAGYRNLKTDAESLYMRGTQADWNTAFGGMDRRSLYAVASNKDGQFTDHEQELARSLMSKQQGDAMGLGGPVGADSDFAAIYEAGIKFLDSVSAEEKAGSFEWALQRANVQYGYEAAMRQQGKEPENFDTTHPVVRALKAAMDALSATNDPSKRLEDMPLYKQAQRLHDTSMGQSAGLVDQTL